jgi:gamma-glutamyl-gamma-aminobutyraldehyde dehydrogenase
MTDLLTHAEYKAIAQAMNPACNAFIDGKFQAASLFSANAKQALRAARDIRAGTVTVNCYGEGDITTPFGGYRQSGFGGRDNSLHAHDQYTELKTIWIDLGDRNAGEAVA